MPNDSPQRPDRSRAGEVLAGGYRLEKLVGDDGDSVLYDAVGPNNARVTVRVLRALGAGGGAARGVTADGFPFLVDSHADVAYAATEAISGGAARLGDDPLTEPLSPDASIDDAAAFARERAMAPPLLARGSTFARYRIEERIGQGGMGEAYRAWDPSLQREVAIKVMLEPKGAAPSATARAVRFEREARTAAAISHPNVVAIYEVGAVGSMAFIAMEYLRGRTLRDVLADGPLPPAEALRVLCDVAKALDAAHERGIVHRDVKPENIMLTRSGLVKVLDFGIAKPFAATPMQATSDVVTAAHVIVGSLRYMAPEQLHNEALDGRADQFAWGVVACELYSGAPPWPFTGQRLVRAMLTEAVPAAVLARVPEPMRAVVLRALEKETSARFSSFAELLAAVDAAPTPSGAGQAPTGGHERGAAAVDRHAETRTSPEHSLSLPMAAGRRRGSERVTRTLAVRRRVVWLAVGAALGAAGIAAVAKNLAPHAVAVSAMAAGPHTVAVLGPKNGTGDAKDDWLSVAISELLTSALGVNGVQTVSGENVANLTRDLRIGDPTALTAEMLQRVGGHSGADLVATGSYSVKGGVLHVAVIVRDVARGVTVASADADGHESEFLAVAQKAAAQLRQAMNLAPLTAVEQTDVRASVPASVAAARAYTGGVERRRAYDLEGARVKFDEAAKLDGAHALTHAALAQVASDLGDGTRAEAEGKLAVELSKGLSRERRLLSEGLYAMQVSDAATAMDRYKALSAMAPLNLDYRLLLVAAQVKGRRFADARKTLDAIRTDCPTARLNPRIDRWEAAVAMGQNDDEACLRAARAAANAAQQQGARSVLADARMFEATALWNLEQRTAALDVLEVSTSLYRSIGDRYHENYVDVMRAHFATDDGQLAEARKGYERALRVAEAMGASAQARDLVEPLATLSFCLGDTQRAKELSRSAAFQDSGATAPPDASAALLRVNAAVARREGHVDLARNYAQRSVERAAAVQNSKEAALSFEEYSHVLLERGELGAALDAANRANEIAERELHELSAAGGAAVARVLLAMGKPDDAETALARAEKVGRQPVSHLLRARALRARANLMKSRLDVAESLLSQEPRPDKAEDIDVRGDAERVDALIRAKRSTGPLPRAQQR